MCEVVIERVRCPTELSIRRQQPPKSSSHGVAETLVARRSDVASESKAGCRVFCLGKGIDQLLDHREVLQISIPQVFHSHTRKCKGFRFCTEALVKSKGERIGPRHCINLLRLRSAGPGWSFYTAGLIQPWIQPCRPPRPRGRS